MAKKSNQAVAAAPAGAVRVEARGDWFARLAARKQELQIGLLVAVAIWLVFGQSLGFAFLDYGDSGMLTDNPVVQAGWTSVGLRYALESYETGSWQPLAWLSHMTDFALLGLDAGAHHFVNVFLHMLNALLLFGLLVAYTGAKWRSGLVALIFAIHPLQVESVAWLSERRTLLAGFFGLAGAWAWLRSGDGNRRWYGVAIACYALTVMSNTAAAPLAILYPLLDRWPAGRSPRWVQAIPLLGLSGVALGIWFWSLTQLGGVTPFPLDARLANAVASIGEYLGTVVWPVNLAAFYPGRAVVPIALVAAGLAVLLLLTGLSIWQRTQRPFLLTGWLWFLLLLLPVLGLVPLGALSRADRFMYLPLAGVLTGVIWGIHSVAGRWEKGALPVFGGLAAAFFAWSAWGQTAYWGGDIVLFEHALKVTGDANRVAHSQIGGALVRLNQVEYALQHLKRAIELDPKFAPSYRQMAEALYKRELNRGSLDMLNKAIALDPSLARSYADRGKVLRALDQLDAAYDSFEQGLKMGLDINVQMDAYFNQGMIRSRQMRYPEAIERFQRALEVDPYFYLARKNLAFTYLRAEKYFEAEREFGLLVRTNPNDEDVVKAMRFLRQRIK
jgi:tetratricopeptide (TPR) repeat protein